MIQSRQFAEEAHVAGVWEEAGGEQTGSQMQADHANFSQDGSVTAPRVVR